MIKIVITGEVSFSLYFNKVLITKSDYNYQILTSFCSHLFYRNKFTSIIVHR